MRFALPCVFLGFLLWSPLARSQAEPPIVFPEAGPSSAGPSPSTSAEPAASAPPPSAPSRAETILASPRCDSYRHSGFYVKANTGTSFAIAFGNGPNGSASVAGLGATTGLSVGGAVVDGLVVGGVVWGATTKGTFKGGPQESATIAHAGGAATTATLSGNTTAQLYQLGVFVDWFPNTEGGWHVGGSVGLGGAVLNDDAAQTYATATGSGALFGGYQFWIGRSWSLGIEGLLLGSLSTKANDSGGNGTGYQLQGLSVGIQSSILFF